MSRAISRRRGTAQEHESFTGALAELTVDTTNNRVVVHDGTTVGGHPQAKDEELRKFISHLSHLYLSGQHMATNAGGLMIRYDDGFKTHYDIARPIHEKYGIPALVAPITDFIDAEFVDEYGGKPGMSWANLIEMQGTGLFEVGLHGKNHDRLSEMTTAQAFTHINGGYEKIVDNMPGHVPKWYVPPYNDGNLSAGVTFAYRLFAKMAKQGLFYQKINERQFPVPSRYMELPYSSGANIDNIVNLILDRVRRGEFVHGMVHEIEDPAKYEEMIQALIDARIPILSPVALAAETHNLMFNPSFAEDLDVWYTKQEDDGTAELDTTERMAGTRSLKLSHPGTGSETRPRILGTDMIRLNAGTEYTFTMWVKASTTTGLNARFQYREFTDFFEGVELSTPTVINAPASAANEWVKLQDTVTPTFDTYARPLIGIFYTGSSPATMHVDSLSITETNKYDFNGQNFLP